MSMHMFFFKQKTAYEMRISDWSSDVCSSDLPVRAAAVAARYAEAFPLAYRTDYGAAEAAIDIGHMRRIVVGEAADTGHAQAHRDEIGRASCRERVCPYV